MSLEEAVEHIQDQVKEAALKCLFSENKETLSNVKQAFNEIENLFTSFNSAYKRKLHFNEKMDNCSVEKVLGVRFDNKGTR